MRGLLGLAFIASCVFIARRDVSRIFSVLKKPAENFVRDVQKELNKSKGGSDTVKQLEEAAKKVEKPTNSGDKQL